MAKSLAIIGAGAKAAALVARAAVLKDVLLKGEVPDIHVFEARHIGAAWDGDTGHSSGFLTLCTAGEKDVGFPYAETSTRGRFRTPPAGELYARFSWNAYLVAKRLFAEWVDRGRDHPTHALWADYLKWVFAEAGVAPTIAKVTAVTPTKSGRWKVDYSSKGAPSIEVDGVVLTGTGRSRAVPCERELPVGRVFDGASFWANRDLLKFENGDGAIAVAGDGGAAGAIMAWLITRFAETDVRILSINPPGTLFGRGDGYAERRWFSDPSEWKNLKLEYRKEILSHTETGVVSMRNKRTIDQSVMVEYRAGKALKVRAHGSELAVDIGYDNEPPETEIVDYLISAIGFDQWSLLDLVDDPAATSLCAPGSFQQRRRAREEIGDDLSLPPIAGLPPGLHIPALGELAHGPGMGNLGCLGLMAQAILEPYIE